MGQVGGTVEFYVQNLNTVFTLWIPLYQKDTFVYEQAPMMHPNATMYVHAPTQLFIHVQILMSSRLHLWAQNGIKYRNIQHHKLHQNTNLSSKWSLPGNHGNHIRCTKMYFVEFCKHFDLDLIWMVNYLPRLAILQITKIFIIFFENLEKCKIWLKEGILINLNKYKVFVCCYSFWFIYHL